MTGTGSFPTERQCEVMVWLVAFMDARGRPPLVRELAAGLGMRSTRSAADHLIRLAALGAIERTPGAERGISVVDPDLWRTVPRARYAPATPARYTGAERPAHISDVCSDLTIDFGNQEVERQDGRDGQRRAARLAE